MTHQELDDLFRANSERGEFAPEPGEWEEMTALLDEDERRERYARWVSIGWISLFVLLISSGIYGLWSYPFAKNGASPEAPATIVPVADEEEHNVGSTNAAIAITASDLPRASMSSIDEIEDTQAATTSEAAIQSGAVGSLSETAKASQQSAFAKTPVARQSASSPEGIVGLSGTAIAEAANKHNAHLSSEKNTSAAVLNQVASTSLDGGQVSDDQLNAIEFSKASSAASMATTASTEKESPSAELSLQALSFSPLGPIASTDPSLLNVSGLALPPVVLAKAQSWSTFSFGLFVAEEATSVAMSTKMRLGTRVGGLLHYKPFEQWSIDVGVSYAHKSYMAPDGEMKNTLGLFVDEVLPVQTDGTCDILEVPLTVSFVPKGHGQAGPFFSGGLMSYRVLREEMVFHYDEPTSQVKEASAPAVGSIFGTAHLQVGYRFVPRKGPVWRVGPYVQVPIEMVGSGKLPIYSGGIQLGVELF